MAKGVLYILQLKRACDTALRRLESARRRQEKQEQRAWKIDAMAQAKQRQAGHAVASDKALWRRCRDVERAEALLAKLRREALESWTNDEEIGNGKIE